MRIIVTPQYRRGVDLCRENGWPPPGARVEEGVERTLIVTPDQEYKLSGYREAEVFLLDAWDLPTSLVMAAERAAFPRQVTLYGYPAG